VLGATESVLVAKGFDDFTMTAVAEQTDVSIGAIYRADRYRTARAQRPDAATGGESRHGPVDPQHAYRRIDRRRCGLGGVRATRAGDVGSGMGHSPMATPEISPAVADDRIDAGITRGEQPGRGVRRYLLRRERVGVQLAQHHPLAEHPEIEIAEAAAYPLRLPDRSANPVVHDQLSAMFRDTQAHGRFRTPAVSFDVSQRDLHDGVTLAPAGEAVVSASPAGLTWRPLRGAPDLTIHLVLPREQ
jgi:LysR substrate binding domain/Bacterial regulatory proteins, tetR family